VLAAHWLATYGDNDDGRCLVRSYAMPVSPDNCAPGRQFLWPALEQANIDGFEDPDEVPITEACFATFRTRPETLT